MTLFSLCGGGLFQAQRLSPGVVPAYAGDVRYLYDDLGRLIAVVDETAGQTAIYQYDAVGNLLSIVNQPARCPSSISRPRAVRSYDRDPSRDRLQRDGQSEHGHLQWDSGNSHLSDDNSTCGDRADRGYHRADCGDNTKRLSHQQHAVHGDRGRRLWCSNHREFHADDRDAWNVGLYYGHKLRSDAGQ